MRKRVPFIEQISPTECGLTCVAMILRYYRSFQTLQELREYHDTGRDGSTIKQLIDLMIKFNLSSKVYKISAYDLNKIKLPAIVFYDNSHYVVLEKLSKKYAWIVNPSGGAYKLSNSEFNELYSGYVIEVTPTKDFIPQKKYRYIWKDLFDIFKGMGNLFIRLFIVSIVIYSFSISIPIIMRYTIDEIQVSSTSNTNLFIFILLLGVVITAILGYIQNYLLIKYRSFTDYGISSKVVRKLLSVSYHFFEMRRKSDLIMTINSGYVIREIIAQQLMTGLIDFGAIIFMSSYLFYQSKVIFFVSVILFCINAFYLAWSRPLILNENRQLINKRSEVEGQQVELIYSILGIKMAGIEEDVYKNWDQKQKGYINKYVQLESIQNKLRFFTSLLSSLSPFIIFALTISMYISEQITLGSVMSLYSLSASFFGLAASVSNIYNSFVNSSVYLERLQDIFSFEKNKEHKKSYTDVLNGNIELNNVSFSYSKHSQKVLKDINLFIEEGQKVGIVGMSGSGKSTLAKIMIGLYKPTEGEVVIDGKNIQEFSTSELRKQMGIVPQDITLFNRTIRYNIGMDRLDVNEDEIIRASKMAQIHDEIMTMPMGYNTLVTEMGTNLSGGQRQRIVLARSILKNPRILVLDEATSSLDRYNEAKIFEYFKEQKCTRIIIAHRLSTIIDADVIIVMDKGQIVDVGTHDELIENSSYYQQIYQGNLKRDYLASTLN